MQPAATPPATITISPLQTLRTLWPYLWPKDGPQALGLRLRVVAAMAFLILAKVATLYVPIFYKRAVDALSLHNASGLIVVPVAIIAAYGLARVLSQVFGELRDIIFARVQARGLRTVAREVFQHLHTLSLRFHLDRRTGGLSSMLDRGAAGIETLLRFMLFNIVPTFVEILLVTGLLWALFSIWFALVTLVTMVGYIAFTFLVAEWRVKYRRQMNEQDTEAKTKAVDSLLNYETVKYFTNEANEVGRYDSVLARREQASVKSIQSLSLLNIGQALIISGGVALIMGMAAYGVAHGTMTVGDFVLVNAYMLQLAIPLGFIGFVYNEIRRALIDMEDMFQLQRVEAEIKDATGATPLQLAGGSLAFEDVRFSYDGRRPILQGVSFTVPAGQTVAIVGPSGAGKSTISRLLFRFYQPQGGRITIDGQDIGAITQASLRAAIGIVPQDTVLFNDTIGYNIGYGRAGATAPQIAEAARLAHIDRFIDSLPDKYATTVGERGLKLSGGEKQRVAIARTALKSPPILLFDEATSALDSRTEQEIQRNLREISVGRTTLVIAHRLSTVIDADEILVLDRGVVAERGSHAALLAQRGLYAEMWQRQQEAAAKGNDPLAADAAQAVLPAQ